MPLRRRVAGHGQPSRPRRSPYQTAGAGRVEGTAGEIGGRKATSVQVVVLGVRRCTADAWTRSAGLPSTHVSRRSVCEYRPRAGQGSYDCLDRGSTTATLPGAIQ